MKPNDTMKDRSIYELWQELQKELKAVYPASMDMTILADQRFTSLRAELLERCENGHESVCYGLFNIKITGDYMVASFEREFESDPPPTFGFHSPSEANNIASMYSFMAWEMEQREKEAQDG